MSINRMTLTDDLIRSALTDLAAGSDAADVVNEVMRVVASKPQARAPWLAFGARRTMLILLAAALLVAALAALIAIGTRPRPLPLVIERTTEFNRPFEYTRPADLNLQVTDPMSGLGLKLADALEAMRRLYGGCASEPQPGEACSVGTFDTPVPLTETERQVYAQHLRDWNAELRALTVSFTLGGPEGDRGVIVAVPTDAPFDSAFWCFGPVAPDGVVTGGRVLDAYRSEFADQPIPEATSSTFDGRPAISVRTPAGRCPTAHATERSGVADQPGVLTLVDVGKDVVAVVVWGKTDAILDEWLPDATRFVQTIHFLEQER